MHKCVRCGKIANTIEEINAGCPCGAKVFIFTRVSDDGRPADAGMPGGAKKEDASSIKPMDTYQASATFSSEDVENVKVLSEGVFLLDVNTLSKNPMVLKDEEGIYYVKLPYESTIKEQNGKKEKKED